MPYVYMKDDKISGYSVSGFLPPPAKYVSNDEFYDLTGIKISSDNVEQEPGNLPIGTSEAISILVDAIIAG